MAVNQSLENLMENKVNKINDLVTATTLITNKDELKNGLLDAKSDLDMMKKNMLSMRLTLNSLKLQNDKCQKLMDFLQSSDEKIRDLENTIPSDLIHGLETMENDCSVQMHSETLDISYYDTTMSTTKKNQSTGDDIIDPTEYLPNLTNCKKTLFTDADDGCSYCIEPLTDVEFTNTPKYMIGRQTLTNINDFISDINKIMKAKYTLLNQGKNKARKQKDLDLYLQFKREEADVCSGKERKYFFSAEDYEREMKCKLNKTRLNLLVILRHCHRIQELRLGKNIKYQVITSH